MIRVRTLALILLAAPVFADDVLLDEVRAWKGEIEIVARSGREDGGEEVQSEKATFVAVTDPRRTAGSRERLQLRLRRSEGSWSLAIDRREDKGEGELVTRGSGEGRLHLSLNGVVDTEKGIVRIKTGVRPRRLVAKTLLSGVDAKGLATFRTVASRVPYMGGLDEAAALGKGRVVSGGRTFEDRGGQYPRTVEVKWRLERLDPEVKGRVLDQHGEPVAGLQVLARTFTSGGMLLREGETDSFGRFSIPVHFTTWGVEIVGRVEDGVLTGGAVEPDAAPLKFDDVPDLELRVTRYELRALPRTELLETHFDGNVKKFLEYLGRRVPRAVMARAEVRPSTR